ncbi:YgjV family protein [Alteriqipengyuania sp.]|uniref:YgjV family protein n=1 Tax=Alteriqipengyuania sp. TaxID=2800692 RepID=UPI0035138C0B
MQVTTDTIVLANIIGFLGYLVFALSPLARDRSRYLWSHAAAMVPIAAHYVLLDALSGALLSLSYLAADAVALRWPERKAPLVLVGAGATIATALAWSGPDDLLGLGGTLIFMASRFAQTHLTTLLVAGASTVLWGLYGWTQGSISQVIFSAAYALFCLVRMAMILRTR